MSRGWKAVLAVAVVSLAGCATTGSAPGACNGGDCVVTISRTEVLGRFKATPDDLNVPTGRVVKIHWRFEKGLPYRFDSEPTGRPRDAVVLERFTQGDPKDFAACNPVASDTAEERVVEGPAFLCIVRGHAGAIQVDYTVRFSDGARQYRLDPSIGNSGTAMIGPGRPPVQITKGFTARVCDEPLCPLTIASVDGAVDPATLQVRRTGQTTVLVWTVPQGASFAPDPDKEVPDGIVWAATGQNVTTEIKDCWVTADSGGAVQSFETPTRYYRCDIGDNVVTLPANRYDLSYRDAQGKQHWVTGTVGRAP